MTIAWLRRNLFSGPLDTALTLLTLALLAWILPVALNWLVFDAVWGHAPVAACDAVRGQGACWAVVWEKFRFMMFGTYPYDEQWRPAIVIVLLCALLVVSGIKRFWNGWLAVIWTVGIALTWWLMGGGAGLQPVRSEQWGGLPVTLILAIFGIAFAFPLGVALALGRRSKLPIVRALSVVYIEVVRGVPLITVLFMASVMFALFMPEGMRIDQLLRAQIAIILFFAIAATRLLGFPELTRILDQVLELGGRVIFGSVVILVGFLISNMLSRLISGSGETTMAASVVKWAAVVLFTFRKR